MRIYRRFKHDRRGRRRRDWYIDFRYTDEGGRVRRCIKRIGPNKKLAREMLDKLRAQAAEGKFVPDRAEKKREAEATFKEFIEEYWDLHWKYLKGRGKRSVYDRLVREFGDRPLAAISVRSIQKFYNAKRDATSAATANRYLARLAHIFEKARKWGKFSQGNPTKEIETEKEDEGSVRFLSKDEIDRLLSASSSRLYPVLVCALHTGMRRGQILGLTWDKVNLDQGIIYVLKAKRGKPNEIPITPQLREELLALGPKKSGPVFHMPVIILRRHFSKALREAKIVDFRFHCLRHTFASHFIMRTNDLPALQKILGHASARMTQRYAHLSKGHLASEMQIFAAAMPKPSGGAATACAVPCPTFPSSD